jgi:hypothetical protein
VVSRAIAGETLVVPVRGRVGDLASIYQLNQSASRIWDALAQPVSLRELARVICDEFEVELEQAENDVQSFVEQLRSAGLIDLHHSGRT